MQTTDSRTNPVFKIKNGIKVNIKISPKALKQRKITLSKKNLKERLKLKNEKYNMLTDLTTANNKNITYNVYTG